MSDIDTSDGHDIDHGNRAPTSSGACTVQPPEPRDSRGTGRKTLIARSARGAGAQPKYKRGQPNKDGYVFGHGRRVTAKAFPETTPPRTIAGVSTQTEGYDVLGANDKFVAWYACFIAASEAHKAHRGPGKVVRCSDRALLRIRSPREGRP